MRNACLTAALLISLAACALVITAAFKPIYEQREHDRLVTHCIRECQDVGYDMGYFDGNSHSWTCTCKNYGWR